MNERIKQLGSQAREYAHEQAAMMDNTYLRAFEDKFAELIVQECAHIAWLNSTEDNISHTKIKEHFGVEE